MKTTSKKIIKLFSVTLTVLVLLTGCITPSAGGKTKTSDSRGIVSIPDHDDFIILKCDFHMHTIFSDGKVGPTVRVDEAIREGLDAIAITEHIEYRPNIKNPNDSHNRSYEIAYDYAKTKNVIVIRGSEITRRMPPGHHNAIFLTDSDKLETPDYLDAFRAAKAQNAFIFWNHPGWERQAPDVTIWETTHSVLLEMGMMHGIEVVNGVEYYPEAHQWCLDKKLTMLGNSDIHQPMRKFGAGEHRPMTLVFARERTEQAIYEALRERRTVVYLREFLIGEEKYLNELFKKSVEISVTRTDDTAEITFNNKSNFVFNLKKDKHDPRLTYFRHVNLSPYVIKANKEQKITVRLNDGIKNGDVNFIVENLLVAPGTGLKFTVGIK